MTILNLQFLLLLSNHSIFISHDNMFGRNLPGTQVGDTEISPFVQVIVDDPEITNPFSQDTSNVAPE